MNIKLPDTIIQLRDAKAAYEQLKALRADTDTSTTPAASQAIIAANQQLVDEVGVVRLSEMYKEAISSSPVFDVILATEPHDTFLQSLSNWFRREIHPATLLRVSVRRNIGGGAIIRSKNRMFDFSLRPKVLAEKGKLPEVLHSV